MRGHRDVLVRSNRALGVAALALLLGLAATGGFTRLTAAEPGGLVTWTVDGEARTGFVYAPTAPSDGAVPLVLSFHGHGDRIANFRRTDMQGAWPDAVVVYPQGLPTGDGLSGWQVERGEDHDRDLKLVDAVLRSIEGQFNIDRRRIYATGFSNGANFTYLLWAERPDVFAAYAPVAARLRPSVRPRQPRPLFHVAGRLDERIPFEAQLDAIEVAKRVDGVSGEGAPCGDGCTRYDNGMAAVMTWVHTGGHDYPPSTATKIARFFRDHPRAR